MRAGPLAVQVTRLKNPVRSSLRGSDFPAGPRICSLARRKLKLGLAHPAHAHIASVHVHVHVHCCSAGARARSPMWAGRGDHTGNMYAALKMPTVRCNRPPTHRRTPFTRAGWGGRGRARYMEYAAWLVRVMVQHRPHMCGCATDKCPSIAANSACIGCLR